MSVRILLVEDNAVNAAMLNRRLTRRGFEVSVASDGLMAVEQARAAVPDLILMDMSLPKLDGWEATRQVRADPTTANIPVIALTAHALDTDRKQSLEAGCDDFETKPIDFHKLLGKMERLLRESMPT
jgi:CheY-like chemotaxis protein